MARYGLPSASTSPATMRGTLGWSSLRMMRTSRANRSTVLTSGGELANAPERLRRSSFTATVCSAESPSASRSRARWTSPMLPLPMGSSS
jgi:hypothetical protein